MEKSKKIVWKYLNVVILLKTQVTKIGLTALNLRTTKEKQLPKILVKMPKKSQKAYYEEVKDEMSFADRVKEYFATIDADTKKKFIAMQLQ